jgi:hypothetical protein
MGGSVSRWAEGRRLMLMGMAVGERKALDLAALVEGPGVARVVGRVSGDAVIEMGLPVVVGGGSVAGCGKAGMEEFRVGFRVGIAWEDFRAAELRKEEGSDAPAADWEG